MSAKWEAIETGDIDAIGAAIYDRMSGQKDDPSSREQEMADAALALAGRCKRAEATLAAVREAWARETAGHEADHRTWVERENRARAEVERLKLERDEIARVAASRAARDINAEAIAKLAAERDAAIRDFEAYRKEAVRQLEWKRSRLEEATAILRDINDGEWAICPWCKVDVCAPHCRLAAFLAVSASDPKEGA